MLNKIILRTVFTIFLCFCLCANGATNIDPKEIHIAEYNSMKMETLTVNSNLTKIKAFDMYMFLPSRYRLVLSEEPYLSGNLLVNDGVYGVPFEGTLLGSLHFGSFSDCLFCSQFDDIEYNFLKEGEIGNVNFTLHKSRISGHDYSYIFTVFDDTKYLTLIEENYLIVTGLANRELFVDLDEVEQKNN